MKNLVYISLLIIFLSLKPDVFESFDPEYVYTVSIVYICVVIHFLIQYRKVDKNWLRFDVLFLVGFTIVHYQIPFLASIGSEPVRPNFVWINKEVINYSLWLSTVSIIAWMLGYSLVLFKDKNRSFIKAVSEFTINYKIFDPALIVIFLLFLVLVGPSFFSGVYDGGTSWGSGANYAFLILRSLLYLRIIYTFREIDFSKDNLLTIIVTTVLNNKLFTATLLIFLTLFMMTGDRGPIMQIGLLTCSAYLFFSKKKFALIPLITGILVASVFFVILGSGRGRDAGEFQDQNIFQRGLANMQESEDDVNPTNELASQVRILYRAVDSVPDKHPYLYGITFFNMTVGVVPFAGSMVLQNLLDTPTKFLGTANFFTYLGQGPNPFYGEGTNILGDIYVNFGEKGTFICMFLFGAFCSSMYKKAYFDNNFTAILVMSFLIAVSIYMSRAMLLTPLKNILYMLVIHLLFRKKIR